MDYSEAIKGMYDDFKDHVKSDMQMRLTILNVIQDQQEQIDELRKEIQKLKGEL